MHVLILVLQQALDMVKEKGVATATTGSTEASEAASSRSNLDKSGTGKPRNRLFYQQVPSKEFAAMDKLEVKAQYSRLARDVKNAPDWVAASYEAIQELPMGKNRNSELKKFVAKWVEGLQKHDLLPNLIYAYAVATSTNALVECWEIRFSLY